jgi:hypothetical protein
MATKDRDGTVERILERLGLQRAQSSDSNGSMLGVFVVGALVGATLALLVGPMSAQPRKKMGQRVDEALAEYDTATVVDEPGAPKASGTPASPRGD